MVWVSVRAAGKFWEEWNGEKKEWGMRSGQDKLGEEAERNCGEGLSPMGYTFRDWMCMERMSILTD
jgi:hypothetical protein